MPEIAGRGAARSNRPTAGDNVQVESTANGAGGDLTDIRQEYDNAASDAAG
jgi:hypothetical protein